MDAQLVESDAFECPYGLEAASFDALAPPTVVGLVKNFTKAAGVWAAAGFPVVSKGVFTARLTICRTCSLWDEDGYAGAGRCRHGSCGCTKLKHWVKTEKCPLELW